MQKQISIILGLSIVIYGESVASSIAQAANVLKPVDVFESNTLKTSGMQANTYKLSVEQLNALIRQATQKLFAVPSSERPGGGTLGSKGDCNNSILSIRPIILSQTNSIDIEYLQTYTAKSQPTLLVYYEPKIDKDITGKFELLCISTSCGFQSFSLDNIPLPKQRSFLSIPLSKITTTKLQPNSTYIWKFKASYQDPLCKDTQGEVLNAWVKYIPKTESNLDYIATLSAQPIMWYDAIEDITQKLQQQPKNLELRNHWNAVLSNVKLDVKTNFTQVANSPIVSITDMVRDK